MKLKTIDIEGKTYAVVTDGKPVFMHDDGKEVAFDAAATVQTISRLNGEAKGHRERAEAAEGKLKGFEGISDAEAARKALETVANLDSGQLVTANKVQEIKDAAKRAAEEQVAAAAKASGEEIARLKQVNEKLTGDLYGEKVGNSFDRSKYVAEKIAVPGDMLRAVFGGRFKVEDGKIVAYDQAGNKMFSRAKPGEVADFDEALEMMVDSYPYRDTIVKGTGHSGSGARPGNGGAGGGRTITRKEFEAMDPKSQMAVTTDKANPVRIVD